MTDSPDLSPTVMECFHQPLPQLLRGHLEYKSVAPSARTAKAIPPFVFLCKSNMFLGYAEGYLQGDLTKESKYSSQQIGPEFEQLTLDNETDLVLASYLFAIKPLLNILKIRFGKKFTVSCEQAAFVFRSAKDNKIVFVLEFQRREQIRYEDYQKALLPEDAEDVELYAKIEEAESGLVEDNEHSLLKHNALSHTKQLAVYAKQQDCEDVALLNWDHLLLFKFDEANIGFKKPARIPTAGETAELTWISEHNAVHNRDRGDFIHRAGIRKALLGFMLEAFEARLGPGKAL
jgi:hypothetical protein